MDAAVSAASHGSLQNFADNNMYLVRVYEEQPAQGSSEMLDRPKETDWQSEEQSLLNQLKSTQITNSSLSKRFNLIRI